ncbi:transketolase [Acetobacterium woodii]|uniref:Transketolase subunit A n=1 Tax=Acetobacterium woodii (strain ATCC 29683 / DSM 1030 / JCM 2381 / KCTC 1655 / WB1) TaxID=931626 RepID=H6LCW5_ACEWD|nr:transketolase [Acetobacterium woodii]AFA49102.1 transketolase subunit A [Acetobacterium woodii DSM 1030]
MDTISRIQERHLEKDMIGFTGQTKSNQFGYGLPNMTELEIKAAQCRLNVIRMLRSSGHGHVGGSFSAIDIISALYFYKMRVNPKDPQMKNRDRFILSAGHKCMAQYGVLAEKGYFEKSILDSYGKLHSKIPGHPDMHKLPGIEANTGALGHGMAIAAGMAMALKVDKLDSKVYVMLGDGELTEGSNWEAVAAASKFGLDNLVVFIDNNQLQISGKVVEVMDMRPIDEKFRAFGWEVLNINGNNIFEIVSALDNVDKMSGKPMMILSQTIKSKGLPIGENDPEFHFWKPSDKDLEQAENLLNKRIQSLQSGLEEVVR